MAAARKVRSSLPGVAEALAAGEITYDHVLHQACRPHIAHQITELVDELLDLARGMVFEPWRRQVEAVVELLDQDGNFDPNDDLDRNQLSIASTIDGITRLDGTLTGDNAVIVAELVNTKADELFRRFTADANECSDLRVPGRRTLIGTRPG